MSQLQKELQEIASSLGEEGQERPLVILTPQLAAYLSHNADAMAWWGTDEEECDRDKKLEAIQAFMEMGAYEQVFANEAFVIYE